MGKKTSDWFVERLHAWGVTRIYGYSGDGINGVPGALQRAEKSANPIEFIQVRHEEMAAFRASGHAKFTGELGVCLATGGPGALSTAWTEALAADRPTVIEVKTDPNVPPLPPHITLKEAQGFLSAVAKGDSGLLARPGKAAHRLLGTRG